MGTLNSGGKGGAPRQLKPAGGLSLPYMQTVSFGQPLERFLRYSMTHRTSDG